MKKQFHFIFFNFDNQPVRSPTEEVAYSDQYRVDADPPEGNCCSKLPKNDYVLYIFCSFQTVIINQKLLKMRKITRTFGILLYMYDVPIFDCFHAQLYK